VLGYRDTDLQFLNLSMDRCK